MVKLGISVYAIPTTLFTPHYVAERNQWRYDVNKDGTKFLMNIPLSDGEEAEMLVVLNWHKELEER